MTTGPLATVLERLHEPRQTPRGWAARCPSHEDRHASLSVALGHEGRVLVHCFAGCEPRAIAAALGLRLEALFADARAPRRLRRPLTEREVAFRIAYREGRRQQARWDAHREELDDAEVITTSRRAADALRALVTRAGESEAAWDLLAEAAAWTREADRLDG